MVLILRGDRGLRLLAFQAGLDGRVAYRCALQRRGLSNKKPFFLRFDPRGYEFAPRALDYEDETVGILVSQSEVSGTDRALIGEPRNEEPRNAQHIFSKGDYLRNRGVSRSLPI